MRFFLVMAVVLFTSPAQADPPTDSESIRLDDLAAPAAKILEDIPGVADVERYGPERPTHRIIHLLDWHYVSKDDYAADLRSQAEAGAPPTDAEIGQAYAEFLDEVEAVQAEQLAIMRHLIEHHGLRRVYVEGLTERDVVAWKAKLRGLKEVAAEMAELQAVRDGLAAMVAEDGNDTSDGDSVVGIRNEDDRDFIRRVDALLEQHRREMLQIGAPGRLYTIGELEDLLPLEDEAAYKAANPLGGTVRFDPAAIEARQDAMLGRMLGGGPFAFVVLGGANDLADNARKLRRGDVEYVKVWCRN